MADAARARLAPGRASAGYAARASAHAQRWCPRGHFARVPRPASCDCARSPRPASRDLGAGAPRAASCWLSSCSCAGGHWRVSCGCSTGRLVVLVVLTMVTTSTSLATARSTSQSCCSIEVMALESCRTSHSCSASMAVPLVEVEVSGRIACWMLMDSLMLESARSRIRARARAHIHHTPWLARLSRLSVNARLP